MFDYKIFVYLRTKKSFDSCTKKLPLKKKGTKKMSVKLIPEVNLIKILQVLFEDFLYLDFWWKNIFKNAGW